MTLNEADTRARYIDPLLQAAGWGGEAIRREHYYDRNRQYTDGRIVLRGNRAKHNEGRKVDYLLRLTEGFPIAVVEAKEEGLSAEAGFGQAKGYAEDLGVPFAYTTNGHQIIEYDFFTQRSSELTTFPGPEELWQRWLEHTGLILKPQQQLADEPARYVTPAEKQVLHQNPLTHPYYKTINGKNPRYYQERAVLAVLERIMKGQARILLTMATGTGKTFIAMQIVWKLLKSEWLRRLKGGKQIRVLFLADRVVLRDQAYNNFSPFASETSDPRWIIDGFEKLSLHRSLYFGIYQSLWVEKDGKRLFQTFPTDFFDLIIIDEAHRSGFGTWREILDYFGTAIHLGMTATPKRTDNVDTYAYFCEDEKQVPIDENDPSQGTRQSAAFEYSLGQGIEDGFLATYKVHRVRTSVDKTGLKLKEAVEQGAEVFVPEDVEVHDLYNTPQFEREITLPDRTQIMVDHLAKLLRQFGPLEKTMVFCVDIEHARLVSRLLNNHFEAELNLAGYAAPIVSGEPNADTLLNQFQTGISRTPIVATTAELLSTGVDVPDCRNVVFMKTVSSPVMFKQIIGRGSRVDKATQKLWFRILDYTGATRLFDEWDRPPGPPPEALEGPFTGTIEGVVLDAESDRMIVGAAVSLLLAPNQQRGPIYTDQEGAFVFEQLPGGQFTLITTGARFQRKQQQVVVEAGESTTVNVVLKAVGQKAQKIRVKNLEVQIADEAVFIIEGTGEQLGLKEYLDYTRQRVKTASGIHSLEGLRQIWKEADSRNELRTELENNSVYVDILSEVLNQTDVDAFDLLGHLTFDAPLITRGDRVEAFQNRQSGYVQRKNEDQREVLMALLEKYRAFGIEEATNAKIFNLPPFDQMGRAPGVLKRFGSAPSYRAFLAEMQKRLYQ
jgi:type I restriction enzyme R subunit